MVEKGSTSEVKTSPSDAERLSQEEVTNSTRRQLDVWRRTEKGCLEGGSQVFRALAFANLSGETSRCTSWWLDIQRKRSEDLSTELRLARELIPEQSLRVFDSVLTALDYWRDISGFTFSPFPDVFDLFADDKERQRWEELLTTRKIVFPPGGSKG